MFNLIKYEMKKTMGVKLIALALTAIIEVIYLIAIARESENTEAVTITVLSLAGIVAIATMGIYSIRLLSKDLNTKQSYMLFMTPNSSYKILGAKYIENGVSIILAAAFYVLLGMLNITLLLSKYGELEEIFDLFRELFGSLFVYLDAEYFISSIFAGVANWLFVIATAYLAVTISATILNGRKHNGLLSFILFVAVIIVIHNILDGMFDSSFMLTAIYNYEIIAIYLFLALIMYFINAWMMDHILSV